MNLVELKLEELVNYVNDDPVRPELSAEFRVSAGKKVYALKSDDTVLSILCVAFIRKIPQTTDDLNDEENAGELVICPYTIWTYKAGAGRKLLNSVMTMLEEKYKDVPTGYKPRIVTLSPKTEIAHKFHTNNGATVLRENATTVNYEYSVKR